MTWFRETLHSFVQESIRVDEEIYSGRTEFQEVRIFRNERLGRVLALDGVIQTTEADEFIYHEMLVHVPLAGHGAARRVLIIGGGDGGCLEEVLKHDVEQVVMVDLDGGVVEVCKQHLRSICGDAFEDPRTDLRVGDGARFVAETEQRFDVIIVDSTDAIGPGAVLFQEPFYADCLKCLNEGGVMTTQNGVPFLQPHEAVDTHGAFRNLFAHHGFYFAAVPTYFGGVMAMGWAGEGRDLAAAKPDAIASYCKKTGLRTRYYNAGMHCAAFAQPTYFSELLAKA